MTTIVEVILGLIGILSLLILVFIVWQERYCIRRKEWLSALFGMGLMAGCLLVAFACFAGIQFIR